MSSMPGTGITFDLLGNPGGLDRTLRDVERRLQGFAKDAERIKATVDVGIDVPRLESQAKEAERIVQRVKSTMAGMSPAVGGAATGTYWAANPYGASIAGSARAVIASSVGGGSGGAGGDKDPSIVSLGRTTVTLYTLGRVANVAADSVERLTKQIEAGEKVSAGRMVGQAAAEVVEGLPIVGGVSRLGTNIVKAREAQMARDAGVLSPAEMAESDRVKGLRAGIRAEGEGVGKSVEAELAGSAKSRELSGLEGFDLQRGRARQAAEARKERLAKLRETVEGQTDRGPVQDQLEKLLAEENEVDRDLQRELARIDKEQRERLVARVAAGVEAFKKDVGRVVVKVQAAAKERAELAKQERKEGERVVAGVESAEFEARQAELRSQGQTDRARVEAIQERARRDTKAALSDAERDAVRRREAAELEAELVPTYGGGRAGGLAAAVVASPTRTAFGRGGPGVGGDGAREIDKTLKGDIKRILEQIRDKDTTARTS